MASSCSASSTRVVSRARRRAGVAASGETRGHSRAATGASTGAGRPRSGSAATRASTTSEALRTGVGGRLRTRDPGRGRRRTRRRAGRSPMPRRRARRSLARPRRASPSGPPGRRGRSPVRSSSPVQSSSHAVLEGGPAGQVDQVVVAVADPAVADLADGRADDDVDGAGPPAGGPGAGAAGEQLDLVGVVRGAAPVGSGLAGVSEPRLA